MKINTIEFWKENHRYIYVFTRNDSEKIIDEFLKQAASPQYGLNYLDAAVLSTVVHRENWNQGSLCESNPNLSIVDIDPPNLIQQLNYHLDDYITVDAETGGIRNLHTNQPEGPYQEFFRRKYLWYDAQYILDDLSSLVKADSGIDQDTFGFASNAVKMVYQRDRKMSINKNMPFSLTTPSTE